MKIICFILCMGISLVSQARSKRVHVWFLSTPKVVNLFETPATYSKMLASNNESHCEKIEGGCFDPQRGFIADESAPIKKDKEVDIRGFSGDAIKCEKGNFFDLYCGKARSQKSVNHYKKMKTGLWIDISGSMKEEDYSKDNIYCKRRKFVELLLSKCSDSLAVSLFTTSIFALGDYQKICSSSGTNNTKRMIQWIEGSKYDDLYIVTDTEEYNLELSTYLAKIQAEVVGGGSSNFYATDLESKMKSIVKNCKK